MGQPPKVKRALLWRGLTRFYDPILRVALRRYNFMESLVADAHIQAGDRVLDLGCGTAALSIAVTSRHPKAAVVGLDADEEILDIARRNLAEANRDVTLVHGMSFAMPFADGTFDKVVSSLLFHHLSTQDKGRTLYEIRRVLKPGGTVHILDWGKPHNFLLRLAFIPVQLFDGCDTTSDNVRGLLPQFMQEAGFDGVAEPARIPTAGGTLSLYRGTKPASGAPTKSHSELL